MKFKSVLLPSLLLVSTAGLADTSTSETSAPIILPAQATPASQPSIIVRNPSAATTTPVTTKSPSAPKVTNPTTPKVNPSSVVTKTFRPQPQPSTTVTPTGPAALTSGPTIVKPATTTTSTVTTPAVVAPAPTSGPSTVAPATATSSASTLQVNLDSNWKLAEAAERPYASASSYIPSTETKDTYTKTLVVGTVKKNADKIQEQIMQFDTYKKQYLLKNNCRIGTIDSTQFLQSGAKEANGFTYQCDALNISGVDLTLNPSDNSVFYNLIYELRSKTLTDAQITEAQNVLKSVKICYAGQKC